VSRLTRRWLEERRRRTVPAEVRARAALRRGERVLAAAAADGDTWLLGTQDHLVVVDRAGDDVRQVPWEQVLRAHWDRDTDRLTVVEVGRYGLPQPVHELTITDPGEPTSLLQLVRERVTASVVLQRRVYVDGRRGLVVVARRPPNGGALTWAYDLDPGVDPADPAVAAAAERGLRAAAEELGLSV
jgi:hypothetical protein